MVVFCPDLQHVTCHCGLFGIGKGREICMSVYGEGYHGVYAVGGGLWAVGYLWLILVAC